MLNLCEYDKMYFFTEGSHSTPTPHFQRLTAGGAEGSKDTAMFFPEISVARWFYEKGIAEKSLILWCRDHLIRPDKVFVDIGAHVGTYSWLCGAKAAHTYAFECGPRTFCYLAANIALHGLEDKITPVRCALGAEAGMLDYIVRSSDGGGNGIRVFGAGDDVCQRIPVEVRTLDSFNISNICCIKIDVEGAELDVLKGAQETLRRCDYPPIVFESWGDWKNAEGVPATELRMAVFAFLEGMHYRIVPLLGATDMYLATFMG